MCREPRHNPSRSANLNRRFDFQPEFPPGIFVWLGETNPPRKPKASQLLPAATPLSTGVAASMSKVPESEMVNLVVANSTMVTFDAQWPGHCSNALQLRGGLLQERTISKGMLGNAESIFSLTPALNPMKNAAPNPNRSLFANGALVFPGALTARAGSRQPDSGHHDHRPGIIPPGGHFPAVRQKFCAVCLPDRRLGRVGTNRNTRSTGARQGGLSDRPPQMGTATTVCRQTHP